MARQQVNQINQQSKGETPLMSGVLQRAAVRAVADKEEEGNQEVESGRLSQSRFVHDFSQVPIGGGGLPKEVSKPPNQTGLPDNLKAGVENLSGYSLDDVRVHYNSPKPAQLQALAYTQGTEIHVAPGQEKHLPHEAWHVVQQKQDKVKATLSLHGVNINDDMNLEHEADQMGVRAKSLGLSKANHKIIRQYTSDREDTHSTMPSAFTANSTPIQLLKVDGKEIKIENLNPELAANILERFKQKDEQIKYDDPQEILDLTRLALREQEKVKQSDSEKKRFSDASKQTKHLLQKYPAKVEKINSIILEVQKKISELDLIGWRLSVQTHDIDDLKIKIIKKGNIEIDTYQSGISKIRKIGYTIGLPSTDEETIKDFIKLESKKDEARKKREPIDNVLKKYAKTIEGKIPGAKLAYRGSLARGVKSPSKYVVTDRRIGLAFFDDIVQKSDPRKEFPSKPEQSFDIDANVELPEEYFSKFEGKIQTGRLAKSDVSNEYIQLLLKVQEAISSEINDLPIPGYDKESRFELYLTSSGKAGTQLLRGTPYPPFMLENAGLTGLAKTLPKFYSREIGDKVLEYVHTISIKWSGHIFLPPLSWWNPYFAHLYNHVKTNGPLAVSMPEVQVIIKESSVDEYTETPLPRNDTEHTQPIDLVPERNITWVQTGQKPETLRYAYEGELKSSRVMEESENRMYFLNIGGETCISFNNYAKAEDGDTVICYVKKLKRDRKKTEVDIIKKW